MNKAEENARFVRLANEGQRVDDEEPKITTPAKENTSTNQKETATVQVESSRHFTISTAPQALDEKNPYIRYQVIESMEQELANPNITEARMEDELERLKNKKVDELEESLLMPQELYNRHVDESFRLRKLEQSLEDLNYQKKSSN